MVTFQEAPHGVRRFQEAPLPSSRPACRTPSRPSHSIFQCPGASSLEFSFSPAGKSTGRETVKGDDATSRPDVYTHAKGHACASACIVVL
jgi:hypothetical protein